MEKENKLRIEKEAFDQKDQSTKGGVTTKSDI